MIRLLITYCIVFFTGLSSFAQSISAKIDIGAGQIKHVHISESGNEWILTTDSKVVLWDDATKKIRWSYDHKSINQNFGLTYPSKAVISGTKVYQGNPTSQELEIRNASDGTKTGVLALPSVDGLETLPLSITEIPGSPNEFFLWFFFPARGVINEVLLEDNGVKFLYKKSKVDQVKWTPGNEYFVSRNRIPSSGDVRSYFSAYKYDLGYFQTPERPLSSRGKHEDLRNKVYLPMPDGKHFVKGYGTNSWDYSRKSNYLIKIFGLTKKEIAKETISYEAQLIDYFGNGEQLLLYSQDKNGSEWRTVDSNTLDSKVVNLPIVSATDLFNDFQNDRLFVADESGNLWVVDKSGASSIMAYSSSGESQSMSNTEMQAVAKAAMSKAEQQVAIKEIENYYKSPKQDPDWYSNKAFEVSEKGMYDAAELAMQKVYDVMPDTYASAAFMAWFKLLNGKSTEAIDLALKAHNMAPFDGLASTIASYAYAGNKNMAKSKEYMKKAVSTTLESKPDDDIKEDIVKLKGRYQGTEFDELYNYYTSIFLNVMSQRNRILTKLKDAQKMSNPSQRLSKLLEVVWEETDLPAPRAEVVGGAYAEAAASARSVGKVKQAIEYAENGLQVLRPLDLTIQICGATVNAAHAYNQDGQLDKAAKYYNEALEMIEETGGDLLMYKDAVLNGLGGTYQGRGELKRAESFYDKALAAAKSNGNAQDIAIAKDNLATVYIEQGKSVSSALGLLRESANVYSSNGLKEELAKNRTNQGFGYMLLGDLKNAVDAFKSAESLYSQLGMKSGLADANRNIGKLLLMLNQKTQAIEYYKKSLQYVDESADPETARLTYANLAGAELGQEQYNSAAIHAKKAIAMTEKLIAESSGRTKRGLLSRANNTYRILSLAHHRSKQYEYAFDAHEKNRSRVMLSKLGSGQLTNARAVQSSLKSNQAMIDYSVVHLHWEVNSHFFPIVLTNSGVSGGEFSDSTLVRDLKQEGEATFLAYLNNERSMLKKVQEFVEEKGVPDNVAQSLIRDSNLEKTIEFYRHIMKKPTQSNEVLRKSYASVFYELLIGNIESQLVGKDELIIIPDGPLAFLPFETLIAPDGQYLVEKYKVKYIQSASILNSLEQRNYSDSREPILAFAGPEFQEVSASDVSKYRNSGQVQPFDLLDSYYDLESKDVSMRPVYVKMGFTKMNELPGTIYETNQIKSIVPQTTLYQRDKATENNFKALSKSNALKNYKVLHFATHGWSYEEIPELSTIVLGQYATERGGEDGYLRVPEIEKLNLQADFVNLSACETALGRLYSSEGVVGLTQAFLIAGAKSISVTQWTVSDEGTAIFMSETYRKVFTQGKSFLDAITETKIEFIKGQYGKRFTHPDYWGPFVYYGI